MKVAFIDHYLDEWHANNYQRFFESAGADITVVAAYGEIDNPDGLTNREWAQKQGVQLYGTVAEAVQQADAVMVLSPDNPERHEALIQAVIPFKKPVYVDKPFCSAAVSAEELFALAEHHGTPMFSSSALRYAEGLSAAEQLDGITEITTTGMGRIDLYAVHQLEMVMRLYRTPANRVRLLSDGAEKSFEIDFGTKTARLRFGDDCAFSVKVNGSFGTVALENLGDYFANLAFTIAEFFKSGVPPFENSQTVAIVKINEAMLKCTEIGAWVTV